MGTPPVDEVNLFGPDLLVAELQEAADALEEMESRVEVKLMVGEAVLKGILTALESNASEAMETKAAEMQKVKEQLWEKDLIVDRLVNSLQEMEDELLKLIEESTCKERWLVKDKLTEKERLLGDVKESKKFVASKEKEHLKMTESMVELALKVDGESRKLIQLEKELKECKESECSKDRETSEMMEKTDQCGLQKCPMVEIVRIEARLKELCLTDPLVEKDKLPGSQLPKIKTLESAEIEIREELQVQSDKVARPLQSGKDSSELLKKLRIENKNFADALEVREKNLKSLQIDMGHLSNRIQDLISQNFELVDEPTIHKAEIEAKETHLVNQKHALQDAAISFLLERNPRQETSKRSPNLREYVEGTQSLKMEMEEKTWNYEMETLRWKVVELTEDVNLLGDNCREEQSEAMALESKVLYKRPAELVSLQSKVALQAKTDKLNLVIEPHEQSMEEKDNKLQDKVQVFSQAENEIAHLKEKLAQNELLQDYNNEVQEIKSHEESLEENQQKQFEENRWMLREAEERISFLEQEVAVKEDLLQQYKNGMDDQSRRFEFEEEFLSTYMESSFQELLKKIVGIQGNLVNVGGKVVSGQNELEAARVTPKESEAGEESLKSEAVGCSKFVHQIQTEVKSYGRDLVQARVDLLDARSESERGKMEISEEWTEMKGALCSKDKEIAAFSQGSESTSAMQRDALVQEQTIVRGALKEIEDLRELKMSLVARIDEERQRVLEVEDALVEQKWKDQVELDVVSTVFWEGKVGIVIRWNKERALLLGQTQMHQELGGQKPSDKEEAFNHVSQKVHVQHGSDVVIGECCLVPPQGRLEVTGNEAQYDKEIPILQPDSLSLLATQNSELRREKEQLLEQKTDEIYKLKREFYKELESIKREWTSDTELRSLARESSGFRHEAEPEQGSKETVKSAMMEKRKLRHDHNRNLESSVGWGNEKSSLLESVHQRNEGFKERDEQVKGVSIGLSCALEKDQNHVLTRARLVENLAALEKERSCLNSGHKREKEQLIACCTNVLEENDTALSRANKDIHKNNMQIGELEGESSHLKHEGEVLRMGMLTAWKLLESTFAGQMQALVASSQQLENQVAQRMKQCNLRLEGVQSLLNFLHRQFPLLLMSETNYQQNVHNLQKAEAEVDMLGDEVDALVDILTKVYSVLNHYSPIIQHYPGLAELVTIVRQEVLHHVCDTEDDSIVNC